MAALLIRGGPLYTPHRVYNPGAALTEGSCLPNGTLAGSSQILNTMLDVLVEAVGLIFAEALLTATAVPAGVLGLNKGRLEAGRDADIVVLDKHCPLS